MCLSRLAQEILSVRVSIWTCWLLGIELKKSRRVQTVVLNGRRYTYVVRRGTHTKFGGMTLAVDDADDLDNAMSCARPSAFLFSIER